MKYISVETAKEIVNSAPGNRGAKQIIIADLEKAATAEPVSIADWTKSEDEQTIEVPDELMPLFNKIGIQIRFHTISGKNEVLTIAHILYNAQLFFAEHPELCLESTVAKEA